MGGKHDGFMTPKAIANRIKAKGLLKLRWYCQMCQKSCRDENGFKCHCMSEAHLRQMALFRERPNQIMTDYSRQFEAGFVGILRIRGRQRILANSVYQEYIADRHHIHMKATQWDSLSTFVQYLGRTGQAEVDETERGWYIKYIDRDPKVVARQQAEARSQKIALDDVQLTEKLIERQIEESKHIEKERVAPTELERPSDDAKIQFQLPKEAPAEPQSALPRPPSVFKRPLDVPSTQNAKRPTKRSAVETLMEDIQSRETRTVPQTWLSKGIIVKIMNKTLRDGQFYKQKGEVIEVVEGRAARVRLLESKTVIRVDQTELETVIPAIGGTVRIVDGTRYRGRTGNLASVEADTFSVTVRVDGHDTPGFPYEHVCKVAQ
ncbi:DNA/RNA-binding protein Kin17 WH-like domain-containing protein [Plasmodiophora brassicae]|uniref:DNA/RNA-binding protein Kin17 WH-like domain-containing protein n=1 Tax=Plasmodiophora brassicae TaxID=37360 RepID=A0A0G4J6K1_PLABS|nr:hypothetical protein PBRA_002978 [Plasmodiophora brassicae]